MNTNDLPNSDLNNPVTAVTSAPSDQTSNIGNSDLSAEDGSKNIAILSADLDHEDAAENELDSNILQSSALLEKLNSFEQGPDITDVQLPPLSSSFNQWWGGLKTEFERQENQCINSSQMQTTPDEAGVVSTRADLVPLTDPLTTDEPIHHLRLRAQTEQPRRREPETELTGPSESQDVLTILASTKQRTSTSFEWWQDLKAQLDKEDDVTEATRVLSKSSSSESQQQQIARNTRNNTRNPAKSAGWRHSGTVAQPPPDQKQSAGSTLKVKLASLLGRNRSNTVV